jgi:hypothetical protein
VALKNKLEDLGLFIVKNNFTNSVCGKYVVETFNFAFVSKIEFPF